jgi:hypothetical protein
MSDRNAASQCAFGLVSRTALVALLLIGCAHPPPPGRVYTMRRPPAVRAEVIPVAPAAGYVWINGFWRWERGDYVWVPGRWARPASGHRTFVAGHWRHDRRGWYYVEGYWR